jgi:transcriptional regulator with XRE-family HTH domain
MPVFNPEMLILARELAGLTQGELAARIGLSQAEISKIEGIRNPQEGQLNTFAKHLHIPVEFFVCLIRSRASGVPACTIESGKAPRRVYCADCWHLSTNEEFKSRDCSTRWRLRRIFSQEWISMSSPAAEQTLLALYVHVGRSLLVPFPI